MPESIFDELKHYVGFGPADEVALRTLHPHAKPHFEGISNIFYDRILVHEGARKVLVEGESMVGRLKVTLVAWMDKLLSGPWDEAYFELRSRIGRVHVRIDMPQHYMFGAMNVIRQELVKIVDEVFHDPATHRDVALALGKVLDLELAVMLHTYREDLLEKQGRKERLATFGQLVGSIGHELRNPLGVMETSLYILKSRVTDERAQKHADRIGEQLHIANHIIGDLLDLIRDRPLNRQPVDLAEVLKNAVGAVTAGEGVRVSLEILPDLPPVGGDALQLRQVFVNLVENAVQAVGTSGEVRVTASVNGQVEVAVEDTGPGIDPAVLRRLFEPLVTTKAKGVGLGLALVRRVVEKHGGTVQLAPGTKGARFVVKLPVARS